jgi:hypothetical protein
MLKRDGDGFIASEGYRGKTQRYGPIKLDPDGSGEAPYTIQVRWHTKPANPGVSAPIPTLVVELLDGSGQVTHKYVPNKGGGFAWMPESQYSDQSAIAFNKHRGRELLSGLQPIQRNKLVHEAQRVMKGSHIGTPIPY